MTRAILATCGWILMLAGGVMAQNQNGGVGSASPNQAASPAVGTTGGQEAGSSFVGHGILQPNSQDRHAPYRDNLVAIKLRTPHVRALFGGFEQGAGLPVGLEVTTADRLRGLELRARAIASTRLYRRFEAGIWIPKVGDERNHLDLWVGYRMRRQDNLFNLGPQSAATPETNFSAEQRSLNLVFLREVTKGLQVGVYGQLATANAYPGRERGTDDLPIGQMFSTDPRHPNWLPGLHTDVRTVSAGLFAELDRRNDEVGLTRGHYLYARLATTDRLRHDRFSDFGWRETELDGQLYLPLGSDYTSLALRSLAILKQTRGGSQIPFYDLAWMGGRTQHRGYRNFRFRGHNLLVLTVEPRRTIIKQSETRGLDLIVFGDAGQVWGDNRPAAAAAARQFANSDWRYALGGGVQYRLNRTTAFRIDIGRGREELRAFFSVSRGF
ncbi:MAG: hypothetical protein RIR86_1759 [Acidobacteriota bacterium]